ncbi:transglutaminase domain-containing protein [Microbacteriaceae bacterium VKM Ac-2855]|nr:transglutaminase domain-containing protein [Microbacteriaceae bacterium VKM Ac-2855]
MSAAVSSDFDPRAGSWTISAGLWIAMVGSASGVGRLLVGTDWLITIALASAVVLGIPALARAPRAHPVLPPLLGFAATVATITVLYLPGAALLLLIPTTGSLDEAALVAQDGLASIASQGLPAIADNGIAFLLVGGALVLAWLADVFAFTVRVPASTGVLLLALLAVPVVIDPSDVSWSALVITTIGYAMVLAGAAALRRRSRARIRTAKAPAAAIVAVVVVVAAGFASAAPGYARSPFSSGVSGTLFNGSIDPVVALGDDLRRPNAVTVLEYSTAISTPVYLRVLSIADFDGENWAPTDPGSGDSVGLDAIEPPDGLSAAVERTVQPVTVEIDTLRSRWLPVPYPLEAVDGISSAWRASSEDGSVSSPGTTRLGDDYTADALVLAPSDAQLADADPVGAGFERYLALPDDVPPIVRQTAETVAADAQTPYDRARALQAYFRSAEFTYSEDTPAEEGYDGDGVGVLAAFLEVKAGYCVHYASAMAVMARQLGIPSRLAMGYQPGTNIPSSGSDTSRFRVSSSDLHAWPELYFAGVGWLPFEPTPSRGAPAAYTLPSSTSTSAATAPGAETSAPEQSSDPAAPVSATPTAASTSTTAATASSGSTLPVPLFWLLAAVVLLLMPSLIRTAQRAARRRRAATGSAEAVWEEVVAVARDVGVPIDDGETPRAIEAVLAAAMARGAGAAPAVGLAALREAVERERYANASGAGFAWDRREPLVAALRATTTPIARLFGTVLPRSFVGVAVRARRAEL